MNRLVFGLNVSTSAALGADPVGEAKAAEALGFDFVSASDHPAGSHPTNETWTMLTWIAAATTRIGVTSRVLGLPFRSPPLLAKMAETLGRLSGGRLTLGLGAGGSDDEIGSVGLPIVSPKAKIDGLGEAVAVIRGLWTEPGFTFDGQHYQTDRAELDPKPAHPIPIWLGTFGDRALTVTGRLADGWIPSLGYAPPEKLGEMRDKVLAAATDAGRDQDDITCILNVEVRIDESGTAVGDAVTGPPSRVVHQLAHYTGLGFNGFNFIPVGPDLDEQRARLALEVIPALRQT